MNKDHSIHMFTYAYERDFKLYNVQWIPFQSILVYLLVQANLT
jgi:hypothetical protein